MWCVVRAGHEIAVVFDSSKNSVTFLNSKGVFSLRQVSAELAMWAQAAELVLPFTGATLMQRLTLALYPHSSPSVQTDRAIERDDDEFDLFVGAEEGASVDMSAEERGDASGRRKSDSMPVKPRNSPASSDNTHSLPHYFPSHSSANQALVSSHNRTTDKGTRFDSFSLHSAKALYHEGAERVFSPSRDGTDDQELVELQLHDNEIVVVKVWRPHCILLGMHHCFILCMHLIFVHQRKHLAQHTMPMASMKVSNPNLKNQDSKTLHIHHPSIASYSRKAARNDTYTHGVLKSLVVTFQGNRFTVFVCAAHSNYGAPATLTCSFIDAQSMQQFKRAVQERSQATEAQQTFPLDDSQQTHQVVHCGALIAAFASKHVTVCLLFVYLRLRLTAAQKTPRMTSTTILNRERREKIAKSKGSVCLITRNLERETGVPGAAIKSLAPPAFGLLLQRAQRRGCSRAPQLE